MALAFTPIDSLGTLGNLGSLFRKKKKALEQTQLGQPQAIAQQQVLQTQNSIQQTKEQMGGLSQAAVQTGRALPTTPGLSSNLPPIPPGQRKKKFQRRL